MEIKSNINPLFFKLLNAIIRDIADTGDDEISLETFAKFLEWFGPLDKTILKRIACIIQKE